ncbi:helix-turn-helix domain-containing protein [Natronolimnohabitans sp. A-GB9]|uniref:helix-turn-helix domain-containing protein n=1 Tax=Natronolimnohabitans sp. A-GB9 TaxID=3069757 RepID=UPI0027B81EA2|nr:helix-turn-helix domain-containing protein [Natronolimnohabitans sp. A-GB9]MDQ2051561.1 helix-turn-helix domain-containing protein [Natronolimnohabitans sp. A-GB9]
MMSTTEQQLALPSDIAAPQTKLVYLSLLVKEEATVAELNELLGLSKLTLLSVLESLLSADLAQRTEEGYALR